MFKPRIDHLTVLNRNLGDNALNLAIRQMLRPYARFKHIELLNNSFSPRTIRQIVNSRTLIFGGGGLIHSYGPSGKSWDKTGTMWNMDLQDIRKIKGNIVLYGVGFNHFWGEPKPIANMGRLFSLLLEKNALIAFRNDGSLSRFLEAFPEFAGCGLREIPDPGFFFKARPHQAPRPYMVLQVAADRQRLRFKDGLDTLLESVAKICSNISQDVYLLPHTIDDVKLLQDIHWPFPVNIVPLRIKARDTEKMMAFYAGADFSITMRGHGQICSIGNGTPNFSIVTHPKVAGFAESIGMEQYSYRVEENDEGQLEASFASFYANLQEIKRKIAVVQEDFQSKIDPFNREIAGMLPQ